MQYLQAAEEQRAQCKKITISKIPELGEYFPKCVAALDDLLPELDKLACCHWHCPGKAESHVLQRMVGKGVSHTIAGLELSFTGHYDEAFALARATGESANLAWLFWIDFSHFKKWCNLKSWERWKAYKPSAVRKLIEDKGLPVPIDKDRYSILSTESTHPQAESEPQRFNSQVPTLGGYYQEAGLISSVNELAAPIATLGGAIVKILDGLPEEACSDVTQKSAEVLDNIGALGLQVVVDHSRDPHE